MQQASSVNRLSVAMTVISLGLGSNPLVLSLIEAERVGPAPLTALFRSPPGRGGTGRLSPYKD